MRLLSGDFRDTRSPSPTSSARFASGSDGHTSFKACNSQKTPFLFMRNGVSVRRCFISSPYSGPTLRKGDLSLTP